MGELEHHESCQEFIDKITISPEAEKLADDILQALKFSEEEKQAFWDGRKSKDFLDLCQKIIEAFPGIKVL